MRRRNLIVLPLVCVSILALPTAAIADTVVPVGRTVTEVTVVGQDVTLNGTSAGSVIVIGGDLTVGPNGRAQHGVTVVGGTLTTAPGGEIDGDVLQLGGSIPHPSGWTLLGVIAGLLAVRFAVAWLILRLARIACSWPTTATMLAASRKRPIRSAAVGALLTAGLLAAGILLALSVVGLIFASAMAGVLLLAASLGVAFALAGVGHDQQHATTITVSLAIPLIGDALLALATIVALGAAFHYLVDERTPHAAPPLIAP